ncbi:acyloxyacyl hydrolase [Shewanella sp. 10N.261.52.F9]|uniref:acyloxyacyl hydrolase n=1 Tax=Shewanella sp. 10N.261.52.F9 TaxID=3229684 RepID=UPI003552F88E
MRTFFTSYTLVIKLILLSLFSSPIYAKSGLELAYGFAPAKNSHLRAGDTWRVSYSQPINHFDDFLSQYNINLRLELSAQHWDELGSTNNHVFSLNPMFQYQWHFEPMSVYLELGIGAAYSHNTYYLDRNLGSNWLFEDKLGVGIIINQYHRLGVSIAHYSNADLANHNDGVDSISIHYGYLW